MTLPSFRLAFLSSSSRCYHTSLQTPPSNFPEESSNPIKIQGSSQSLQSTQTSHPDQLSDLKLQHCLPRWNSTNIKSNNNSNNNTNNNTNNKKFTECSRGQSDLDWPKTGHGPNGLTDQDLAWTSALEAPTNSSLHFCETSFEEISWLAQSPAYESGDSLDSFSSPTSLISSPAYSLPPTPPATPPNSSQWLPAEVKSARFSCSECCKVFGDRAHLAEHHRYRHSEDRPHRCPTCSKGFKSRSNLNQHIKTAHERPRFDCQLCDRTSFSESGYRYHLLTAHPEPDRHKPFSCPSCDMSFVQQKLLRKHLASRHTGSDAKHHTCPFCPASFKRKDHVTRHVTDTHSLVAKLFECATCDAKFQSASQLRQHTRLHEDRGGFYECPICKERIVRMKGFKKHVAQHKTAENAASFENQIFDKQTFPNNLPY